MARKSPLKITQKISPDSTDLDVIHTYLNMYMYFYSITYRQLISVKLQLRAELTAFCARCTG